MAGSKKSPSKSKASPKTSPKAKAVSKKVVTSTKVVAPKKPSQPKKSKVTKQQKSVAKAPASSSKPKAPKAEKPKTQKVVPSKKKVVVTKEEVVPAKVSAKSAVFLKKQRERLLILKDTLLDSMNGVARDSLRSRAEGSEASAFGMHQADAGSDAYDRDFALSLLSMEQDSLYEINEAIKRIDAGAYGVCEISNKPIPHARLEALPFTRYTVECQAELEKRNRFQSVRQPVTSLFGLNDEGEEDSEKDTSDSED
ncbi:MAG: TraR/DksA C4-type zinc finger protein [Terrimicrobiaceae bacterium]